VSDSLNQSLDPLLLAPRVKPRWWSYLGRGSIPCGSGSGPEWLLGRGRKSTNSTRLHGPSGPCRDTGSNASIGLAPNRSAGSTCLEAGGTGVRGATEYISGRGFVITALPALATNHRQRCRRWFARLTSEMKRRIDRPSLGLVRPRRLQDRAQWVSRSRFRWSRFGCPRSASAVRGRSADTRLRGMPVFEVRQLIPHRMGWPRPSPSL
jgi:hypothetical protein